MPTHNSSMVMQEFMSLLVNSDSPRGDHRARSAKGERNCGTPQRGKITPRLDTRASTFISGISDWSNESFQLDRDPFCLDSRQSSSSRIHRESTEGRLSRSLKQWMPDYEMRSFPPKPHPPRQPIFSARLAKHVRIRRSESTESVNTLLSLFSCSSYESQSKRFQKKRRRRKKKQQEPSGEEDEERVGHKSIWVELASRKDGALDKMLRLHAMYAQMDTESEIYKRLPEDEKIMVTHAGYRRGIILGPGRQRSDSCSNVHKKLPKKKKVQRSQSAGGTHEGPMLDFREVRRQYINQRLASLQQLRSRHSSRRSITRSLSRHSLTSSGSNDVLAGNTPRETSPLPTAREEPEEDPISVWRGDSQILAIDLRRELTSKVRGKIATTTCALERATGFGDDNAPRIQVGILEEYPFLVEEDYSHVAKIPQRVRISPQLSDVIRTDIHVRMGRPRYHEIRTQDLGIWNKGQYLDRAHRNLKVFNWLHSLRESEFDMRLPEPVDDTPPGGNVTTRDEVVVSVDEPKVKPLLERLKHEYIV